MPTGGIFYFAIRHVLYNQLHDCTAKHYQCFVCVSENFKFPKTLVGNIPTPLCAPQPHFAITASSVWPVPHEASQTRSVVVVCGQDYCFKFFINSIGLTNIHLAVSL